MTKTLEVTIPMLNKVQLGHALDDVELKLAIKFYTDLSHNLDKITLVKRGYAFASCNTRLELERLKMLASNRKMKV